MTHRHKLLVPDYIQVLLQQMGLQEEFVFWQHATDFLREAHETHVMICPVERGDKIYFDYSLLSPFGEDWENEETIFESYYDALEDAIVEAINSINEGHGTNLSRPEELRAPEAVVRESGEG